LQDPIVLVAAVEGLRSLIDAMVAYPEERRGEVRLSCAATWQPLRGDDGPSASI
jgi:hypothetical protein